MNAGDVQWTTAGRGIVHAEGPTKAFIKKGGELEGIQLWLNLPAEKKMMPANYQHVKNDDFLVVSSENSKVNIQVIAGELNGTNGRIGTQTSVNAYIIDIEEGGEFNLPVPKDHQSIVYLLNGEVTINDTSKQIIKKETMEPNVLKLSQPLLSQSFV